MKNVILIVVNMMIAVLTFAILMTMDARMARYQELTSNLSSVAEETIGNLMQTDNYEITNYDYFIADLIENLAVTLDADSDILVKVMKADIQKGILALEVTEKYKHMNGREGKVSCQKIVIFNQLVENEVRQYQISFYLSKEDMLNGDDEYKKYVVTEGDAILPPKSPVKDNNIFDGWYDAEGERADFSEDIVQDICYYAQWR